MALRRQTVALLGSQFTGEVVGQFETLLAPLIILSRHLLAPFHADGLRQRLDVTASRIELLSR